MVLIATIGIFALMRLWVTSLQSEIGIRRALGARRPAVIAFVLGRAFLASLAGVLIALTLGQSLWGTLPAFIPGLPAWDPGIMARQAGLLTVGLLAGRSCPLCVPRGRRRCPSSARWNDGRGRHPRTPAAWPAQRTRSRGSDPGGAPCQPHRNADPAGPGPPPAPRVRLRAGPRPQGHRPVPEAPRPPGHPPDDGTGVPGLPGGGVRAQRHPATHRPPEAGRRQGAGRAAPPARNPERKLF